MICPTCQTNTLNITQSLELPPDVRNDEISLQAVQCASCGLQALAVYRESRRGSLGSESWVHEGYRVSEVDFQRVSGLIGACPNATDKRCPCESHTVLGHQTEYHWDGLAKMGVEINGVFVDKAYGL